MSRRRRAALALVGAALLQVGLPAASDAALLRCKSSATRVHSFNVATEWTKKVYKRSEYAVVTVTVTRPAHEDPLDNGIPITPPVSLPEAGVRIATQLHTGRYPFPYAVGDTDENGQVKLKLPLSTAKAGTYDVSTYGNKFTNQNGPNCSEIEEWGYLFEYRGITIK